MCSSLRFFVLFFAYSSSAFSMRSLSFSRYSNAFLTSPFLRASITSSLKIYPFSNRPYSTVLLAYAHLFLWGCKWGVSIISKEEKGVKDERTGF